MTTLTFTTQGFDVGYGPDGFHASGETTQHAFDETDYEGPLPRFSELPLTWRINTGTSDTWEMYVDACYRHSVTKRAEVIKSFFAEYGQPVGCLRRWEPGTVNLRYSLSPDPALATFIMGVLAAGREISFFCPDFQFVEEEVVAPAPTVSGFMEDKEPAFVLRPPILTMR